MKHTTTNRIESEYRQVITETWGYLRQAVQARNIIRDIQRRRHTPDQLERHRLHYERLIDAMNRGEERMRLLEHRLICHGYTLMMLEEIKESIRA